MPTNILKATDCRLLFLSCHSLNRALLLPHFWWSLAQIERVGKSKSINHSGLRRKVIQGEGIQERIFVHYLVFGIAFDKSAQNRVCTGFIRRARYVQLASRFQHTAQGYALKR